MIYRKLDSSGDYTFGKGGGNFLKNSPETVAQAVKTRLLLEAGEWFLNTAIGTPYRTQIVGKGASSKYDAAIRAVILGTAGVTGITNYASSLNNETRALNISCDITTIYGSATVIIV